MTKSGTENIIHFNQNYADDNEKMRGIETYRLKTMW